MFIMRVKSSARLRRSCADRADLASAPGLPRRIAAAAGALLASGGSALAEAPGHRLTFSATEVIQLATFAGVLGGAVLSAAWVIRERARIASENGQLRSRLADLNIALQRSEALLNLKDQRVVVWAGDRAKADVIGALPADAGAPEDRSDFLALGRWLSTRSAAAVEAAIAALRDGAAPFDLVAETQSGSLIEVQGRNAASFAVVKFLSLSENQRAHARLRAEHQILSAESGAIRGLLDALPMPVWLRGPDGRLRWVNKAYAAAVETAGADETLRGEVELLGAAGRQLVALSHGSSPLFSQMLPIVVGGDRRLYEVTEFAGPEGSAALALDRTEIEAVREEQKLTLASHSETLDQLNTAVAMFDGNQKLRFFNQAFQKLWDLDDAFLDSAPDNTIFLDRLRSSGKIAEQPEWRRWKENILSAYRAVKPQEELWYLPDGRTLRVVATPSPVGGVTWVFENLTEKIDLESRYNTAVKVRGETLDNLAEGVAVFGSDGRLQLSNPAFGRLWNLPSGLLGQGTHISMIRAAAERLAADSPWAGFVGAVTGYDDERLDRSGQTELADGKILSHALVNLPNGQVMLTFVDVTDSVNVERALKEKNDALQMSDQLKNEFVQHVSYELRSPLTNIIGFTDLLASGGAGPLNPRQRDYVDHISSSSSVLLTIVNDILDLATVDAGIMELDISEVPVAKTIEEVGALIADRLREHAIALTLDVERAPAAIHADEQRLRQILFNLLANAANYAPEGSVVVLACRRTQQGTAFMVHDDGPGMPQEVLDTVFHRFKPRSNGGRKRGAGLGLSIVKSFMDLHGGSVDIDTGRGRGTTVTCLFPDEPASVRSAAE